MQAEYVLREFTRGSHLAGVVLRVGRPGCPRFLLSEAAAVDGILELLVEGGAVDGNGQDGGKDARKGGRPLAAPMQYHVKHQLDPQCMEFEDEAAAVTAHAAAATAAAAAVEAEAAVSAAAGGPSEVEKVLLLGANGMLGPPVVNELGDSYTLTVTDLNPYGWRKKGDDMVDGTGERSDIDLIKPLAEFARPCHSELLDVADQAAVDAATAAVDATVNCAVLRPHPKVRINILCFLLCSRFWWSFSMKRMFLSRNSKGRARALHHTPASLPSM